MWRIQILPATPVAPPLVKTAARLAPTTMFPPTPQLVKQSSGPRPLNTTTNTSFTETPSPLDSLAVHRELSAVVPPEISPVVEPNQTTAGGLPATAVVVPSRILPKRLAEQYDGDSAVESPGKKSRLDETYCPPAGQSAWLSHR